MIKILDSWLLTHFIIYLLVIFLMINVLINDINFSLISVISSIILSWVFMDYHL